MEREMLAKMTRMEMESSISWITAPTTVVLDDCVGDHGGDGGEQVPGGRLPHLLLLILLQDAIKCFYKLKNIVTFFNQLL